MPVNNKYDVCLVCFESPKNDARLLNMARVFVKNSKKVCIIASGEKTDCPQFAKEKIDFYPINLKSQGRFWQKWIKYNTLIKPYIKKTVAPLVIANDFYSLYAARNLAVKFKAKLVYDSREIYSQLGPLHNHPFKQKIISRMENYLIKSVDRILVSGDLDAAYLKKHFGRRIPYTTIMNLPPFFSVDKSQILRQTYGIPDSKIILIYQGVLLKGRGLLPAIRALSYSEDIYLCIIGDGKFKDRLINEAESLKVSKRVIFIGKLDYDSLLQWTASADVGLCFIEPITISYKLALPNKLFECIMAKVPVVASDLPAMKDIVNRFGVGKVLSSESSPEKLALAVKSVYVDHEKYIENCKNAARELCYEAQEDAIMNILNT